MFKMDGNGLGCVMNSESPCNGRGGLTTGLWGKGMMSEAVFSIVGLGKIPPRGRN